MCSFLLKKNAFGTISKISPPLNIVYIHHWSLWWCWCLWYWIKFDLSCNYNYNFHFSVVSYNSVFRHIVSFWYVKTNRGLPRNPWCVEEKCFYSAVIKILLQFITSYYCMSTSPNFAQNFNWCIITLLHINYILLVCWTVNNCNSLHGGFGSLRLKKENVKTML